MRPRMWESQVNAKQPICCSFHLKEPRAQAGGGHCRAKGSKDPPMGPRFCQGAVLEQNQAALCLLKTIAGRAGW